MSGCGEIKSSIVWSVPGPVCVEGERGETGSFNFLENIDP